MLCTHNLTVALFDGLEKQTEKSLRKEYEHLMAKIHKGCSFKDYNYQIVIRHKNKVFCKKSITLIVICPCYSVITLYKSNFNYHVLDIRLVLGLFA